MATINLPFAYNINDSLPVSTCILVDTGSLNFVLPVSGSFILFNKDNEANLNSVLGYYAEVKMVNNSKTEAELFAVSANVAESSK